MLCLFSNFLYYEGNHLCLNDKHNLYSNPVKSQVSAPVKASFPFLVLGWDLQNQTEDLSSNPCVQNSASKLLHAPNRCFPFRLMHRLWTIFFLPERKYQHGHKLESFFWASKKHPWVATEVARSECGEVEINLFVTCSPHFRFPLFFSPATFYLRNHLRY